MNHLFQKKNGIKCRETTMRNGRKSWLLILPQVKTDGYIGIVLWTLLESILKLNVVTRKQIGLLNYFGRNDYDNKRD